MIDRAALKNTLQALKTKMGPLLSLAKDSPIDFRPVIQKGAKGKAGLYIEVKTSEERDQLIEFLKGQQRRLKQSNYKNLLNEFTPAKARSTKFIFPKGEAKSKTESESKSGSESKSESGSGSESESGTESESGSKSKGSKKSKRTKASRTMARELMGGGGGSY
jgi:hypothetical protein